MKAISIESLEMNKAVYVRSIAGDGKAAGDVNIILHREGDGKPELLVIPKTHIPIKVTDFATPKMIVSSTDFRRALASGRLELVEESEAIKELSTPIGMRELERVRKKMFLDAPVSEKEVTPIEVLNELGSSDVAIRVKDIMLRSIDEDEKLSLLMAEARYMKNDDFRFVLSSVEESSEIGKWARDHVK